MTPSDPSILIAPIGAVLAAANPEIPAGRILTLRCAPATQGLFVVTNPKVAREVAVPSTASLLDWRKELQSRAGLRVSALQSEVSIHSAAPTAIEPLVPDLSVLFRLRFPDLPTETTSISVLKHDGKPAECRPTTNMARLHVEEDPETCKLLDGIVERWLAATDIFGKHTWIDLRFPLQDVSGHARMAAARRLGL